MGSRADFLSFQFTPISPAPGVVLAYDTSSVNIGLMKELVPTHKRKTKQTALVKDILVEIPTIWLA